MAVQKPNLNNNSNRLLITYNKVIEIVKIKEKYKNNLVKRKKIIVKVKEDI